MDNKTLDGWPSASKIQSDTHRRSQQSRQNQPFVLNQNHRGSKYHRQVPALAIPLAEIFSPKICDVRGKVLEECARLGSNIKVNGLRLYRPDENTIPLETR